MLTTLTLFVVFLATIATGTGEGPTSRAHAPCQPNQQALADIPNDYLAL